ncbi:unnamed protein product [Toxocara canis]|uniref:G domain-containing protein n=1 Tax=Toxocara canis TaxID=6265 RepID=A0A183TYA4_TOXCA|nr:unnamed protein product [Toxocara canis]
MVRHEKVLRGERGDRFAREIITGGEQKPKNGVVANRKTVLLLGRSRAGKTSLINAFANYLFGVKEEDDFRYTVLPMHRRTASINLFVRAAHSMGVKLPEEVRKDLM